MKRPSHKSFDLPTADIGTIAELVIAIDLFKKGYEVYRSISPKCSGDLMIEKDKTITKIEVRTGYRLHPTNTLYLKYRDVHSPIIAVVIHKTNEVKYLRTSDRQEINLL